MLEHVLEAIAGVQQTADAIEAKTDMLPVVVTDTFQDVESSFIARTVEGTDGREFLANFTVQCSFGTPDNSTALNSATVSLRLKTPTGAGPFTTSFQEKSTDRIVTVVTGPVAGFAPPGQPAYHVFCSPGTGNTFSQGLGQAWFEVLP